MNLEDPPGSLPLFLKQLAGRATNPLDLGAAHAETLDRTRSVTAGRLERLVSGSAALWCRHHDDGGARRRWIQPELYPIAIPGPRVGAQPAGRRSAPAEMTALSEQALGAAPARRTDHLWERCCVAGATIDWGRTASGSEIDLVPVGLPSG